MILLLKFRAEENGFRLNIEKLIKGEFVGIDRIEYKSGWNPEAVIELFVSIAAVFAGALIFDLHKYSKEQRVKDKAGVQNGLKINS